MYLCVQRGWLASDIEGCTLNGRSDIEGDSCHRTGTDCALHAALAAEETGQRCGAPKQCVGAAGWLDKRGGGRQ